MGNRLVEFLGLYVTTARELAPDADIRICRGPRPVIESVRVGVSRIVNRTRWVSEREYTLGEIHDMPIDVAAYDAKRACDEIKAGSRG
jgi:hypothetical protein